MTQIQRFCFHSVTFKCDPRSIASKDKKSKNGRERAVAHHRVAPGQYTYHGASMTSGYASPPFTSSPAYRVPLIYQRNTWVMSRMAHEFILSQFCTGSEADTCRFVCTAILIRCNFGLLGITLNCTFCPCHLIMFLRPLSQILIKLLLMDAVFHLILYPALHDNFTVEFKAFILSIWAFMTSTYHQWAFKTSSIQMWVWNAPLESTHGCEALA